jgi:hypothetical protein
MLGVFATTVKTWEIGGDEGYGATVEAKTMSGAVVGRADAVVMRTEAVGTDPKTGEPKRKWLEAPAFQLISMAQTRASSKALRMPLGFVMKLAGYDTTPAEEMEAAAARGETVTGGKGVAPGWKDLGEQVRVHMQFDDFVTTHGLRQWVAEWLDSKSYTRPLAKGQMNQLRRAIDRELEERKDQAEHETETSPGAGPPSAPGAPTSGRGRAGHAESVDGNHVSGEGSADPATTPAPDSLPGAGEP